VILRRLLECNEIKQVVADHGAPLDEIRSALLPLGEEALPDSTGGGRLRGVRSWFDRELSDALSVAKAEAREQSALMSASMVARSILSTSSVVRSRVAPFGMDASWFEQRRD
jgi:hypothetical protein